MSKHEELDIQMIPLEKITIVNPRDRGQKKFRQITKNIANIGLKKPITVTLKPSSDGAEEHAYLLVCGQGRYEAYQMLGQAKIPAIVIEVTKEKLFLMSLIENLARRQPSSVELVHEIGVLKDRGYSFVEIAAKTDLTATYVRGIIKLIRRGEEKLLMAVERGQIPLSVAVAIATSDDHDVQRALTEAYESNDLRGRKLLAARRLIEKRQVEGKSIRGGARRCKPGVLGKELLGTYQRESARQRMIVQKSKLCEARLLFVVSAIHQLVQDKRFIDLLRAESLNSMPSYLTSELQHRGEIS